MTRWRERYIDLRNLFSKCARVQTSDGHAYNLWLHLKGENFFDYFDEVRRIFVEENFSEVLNELELLSRSYKKVEGELYGTLQLNQILLSKSSKDLERFLHDPKEQLIRELFDILISFWRKDPETFEKEALERIRSSLQYLYPLAYEKWVELSIVKLLNPKKVFYVPLYEEYTPMDIMKRAPTIVKEHVPFPEESTCLFLEREGFCTLIVPDFIIYSARLCRFVAFKSRLRPALWIALNPPEKRDYILVEQIEEKVYPHPSLTIYMDRVLENLSLIADATRIYVPDLMINIHASGAKREELLKAKIYHKILKPKMGTFVVSKDPLPEHLCEEFKETNLYFLTADLECSKLDAIATYIEREASRNHGKV
jgi:hypothetical protein